MQGNQTAGFKESQHGFVFWGEFGGQGAFLKKGSSIFAATEICWGKILLSWQKILKGAHEMS